MRPVSHYINAPFHLPAGGESSAAVVRSETGINTLASPVVLVTKGKGRKVFKNSRQLILRLEAIAEIGEEILQINNNVYAVPPDGIAALNTMLAVCGLRRFRRAAKRSGNVARAPYTRFEWAFLSLYLGWEWKPLK
jgi:hypothetical protein